MYENMNGQLIIKWYLSQFYKVNLKHFLPFSSPVVFEHTLQQTQCGHRWLITSKPDSNELQYFSANCLMHFRNGKMKDANHCIQNRD